MGCAGWLVLAVTTGGPRVTLGWICLCVTCGDKSRKGPSVRGYSSGEERASDVALRGPGLQFEMDAGPTPERSTENAW